MARRAALVLLGTCLAFALAGTASASSPVERQIDSLFWAITWFAILVAVITFGILAWFLWKYRESASPVADTSVHGSRKVEFVWTAFPIVILTIITVISVPVLLFTDTPPPPDATVRVIGFQWGWRFEYENGTNQTGEVWIRENAVVHFQVTSVDVIHSFRLPQLGVTIDAIPGRWTRFWVRAEATGDYITQCAEFCGAGHYGMRATVRVFDESEGRLYGPPPRLPRYSEVHLNQFGGSPYRIDPPVVDAVSGEIVRLWIWNNNSVDYTFLVDDPVNASVLVPSFGDRWLNFTPIVPADMLVPYGPTDASARASGMVGALNVTVAILIELDEWTVRPDPLDLPRGVPVKFLIRNVGAFPHNFTMGGIYSTVKYDPPIESGESVVIGPYTFAEDTSNQYWCNIPGHRGQGMHAPYNVGAGGEFVEIHVPVYDMLLISFLIGGVAILAYVVHHARRRD